MIIFTLSFSLSLCGCGNKISEISFPDSEKKIIAGTPYMLSVTVEPSEADTEGLEWSSSDDSIVSIEKQDGKTAKVKALKRGTAEIRCKAPNGPVAVLPVTVKTAPAAPDPGSETYGGKNPNEGVGDTTIYKPIESTQVETPEIDPVKPDPIR